MEHVDVVGLGVSVVDILQLVDHYPSKEEIQGARSMAVQGGGQLATAMVTLDRLGAKTKISSATTWPGSGEFQ